MQLARCYWPSFFILVRVEKEQSGELYGVELCMYYTAED